MKDNTPKNINESLIQMRRDWLDCGCVPCDRGCHERKELINNLFDDVVDLMKDYHVIKKSDVDGVRICQNT